MRKKWEGERMIVLRVYELKYMGQNVTMHWRARWKSIPRGGARGIAASENDPTEFELSLLLFSCRMHPA